MEVELHDGEFDLGDVVDDFTMSDDELEKELKELEEEGSGEKSDTIDTTETTANDEGRKNGHSEQKSLEDKSDNLEKRKTSTRCEIYEEVDRDSSDYHRERLNNYSHHRRRSYGQDQHQQFDLKRLNKSLHISSECDDMIVGREVAYRLCEEKVRLFGHVVRVLGQRTTSDIFAETKEIVNHGGIKTELGDRMRSPGGTFLYLMKSRGYATPEQIKEIFKEENESQKKLKKRKRDANFTRFHPESLVKKEPGHDDEQPSAKKKKKKSKAVRKESDESGKNTHTHCSPKKEDLEKFPLEKDLPTPAVDDTGVTSTVCGEEIVDERPPVNEVKQEPDDLEDGEID